MAVLVKKSPSQSEMVLKLLVDEGLISIPPSILLKSAQVFHHGEQMPMGFGPKELFDPIMDDEGNRRHHPLFGFNPKTQELEHGDHIMHPIPAVEADLQRRFNELGWDKHASAKVLMHESILHHNRQLPDESNQRLPGIDSHWWERSHIVPHPDKGTEAHQHQVMTKDGYGRDAMGTYAANRGDVDTVGASKGMKVDSGLIVFNNSLGQKLIELNEKMVAKGLPPMVDKKHATTEEYIANLPYVKSHTVPPELMNPNVSHLNKASSKHLHDKGKTPYWDTPEGIDGLSEDELIRLVSGINFVQGGLPDHYFAKLPENRGGAKAKDSELGSEPWQKLRANIDGAREELGIPQPIEYKDKDGNMQINDKAFERFMENEGKAFTHLPVHSVLHGQPGSGKGKFATPHGIMLDLHEHHGINPDDVEAITDSKGAKEGGGRSRGMHASKMINFARHVGHDAFINTPLPERWEKDYAPEQRQFGERIATAIANSKGYRGHNYEAQYPEREVTPAMGRQGLDHTDMAEHYGPYVTQGLNGMKPHIGETEPAPAPAPVQQPPPAPAPVQAPRAPAPLATRQPTSAETQIRDRAAMMTPEQMVPHMPKDYQRLAPMMQAGQQPGQQFWDEKGQLVLRSRSDIVNAMGDIQKAMEEMQLNQAMNDGEVKKHIKPLSDLYGPEVGMFAKNLGLTSNDIRAINSSKGQWDRIAKQWNVSELTVKVIKTSIGSV